MRLGVISDTHSFFDPAIPRLFAGVEHILHAGDVGSGAVILELERLAPVTAVAGNTDDEFLRLRQTAIIVLAGQKFMIRHVVNPASPGDALKDQIVRDRPDVVVFGHSHKPFARTIDGTVFFNPGYAGKPRFGMKRTVAILDCDREGIRPLYFSLETNS